MSDRHTGENIARIITDMKLEFGLQIVTAIVTDNAANMLKADTGANLDHTGCFAHTLQLAVNDGLKHNYIARTIGAARKVVGHFNHSVLATEVYARSKCLKM